ncbi:MAG TPA: hypothetical protein DDY37_04420 [Legionella sp.]|nr:hypothetical protein [Legionella sp.]
MVYDDKKREGEHRSEGILMTPWFLMPPFFHLLNFNDQETYHSIRFEKDTRYYSMCIEKDLLDDWVIVVINGRIQTKLGKIRTLAFTCFSDAFEHFCGMIQIRLKRHYHLKSYQGGHSLFLQLLAYAPMTGIEDKIPKVTRCATSPKTLSKALPQNMIYTTPTQMGFSF